MVSALGLLMFYKSGTERLISTTRDFRPIAAVSSLHVCKALTLVKSNVSKVSKRRVYIDAEKILLRDLMKTLL